MMTRPRPQQGFTAVELLITLFVAAAFLIAGYQLFSIVIKDGGETRAESTASNVAYTYLRQYGVAAANPCVASQPLTASSISEYGLANAKISIQITCPQNDALSVSKVEAVITYGNASDKTVKYATFVDASKGAMPTSSLTAGAIGMWSFNGNANDTSGYNLTGTVSSATLATGQNGAANSAYSFNGSNAYITIPSTIGDPTSEMTASAWIKIADVRTSTTQKIVSTTQSGGYALAVSDTLCPNQIGFLAYINGAYRAACSSIDPSFNNSWVFVTGVFDGSTVRFYFNGTQAAAVGVSGAFTYGPGTVPLCIGSEPSATVCTDGNYFNGSIDDVRIYNRALTPSEIQLIYAGGAS